MKILESHFYRPKRLMSLSYDSEDRVCFQEDLQQYLSKGSPYEALLDDILSSLYLRSSKLVINQSQLKELEQCTDFHPLHYCGNLNQTFQNELCYFHSELEIFVVINIACCNEEDKKIRESGHHKVSTLYYQSTNPEALERVRQFMDGYLQAYESDDAKVSILLKESHGLVFKTQIIKPYPINIDTMYNDDFLPVHQHIKAKLTEDNKGVVLLHGIAGSGKTNYIKWLTSQVPNKQFIFVPTTMISYLTDPEMMSMLIDNKNSILVLEDCENYIAQRTVADINTDVVSSILNIADGMLSDVLECQFICTFNSDISSIDNALLRKGRLIAEYQFDELSAQKANQYLASISTDSDADRQISEPISLAELTNLDNVTYKEKVPEKRFGFIH